MTDTGNGVLVVGEVGAGEVRPISFEALGAGRAVADALGQPLIGLVMGSDVAGAARVLAAAGADRVLVADDARLASLTAESGAAVLAAAIAAVGPGVVLVPGTTAGRDYAPRVAARLGVGLAADCVDLAVENGRLIATRAVLGGRVLAAVSLPGGPPQMATLRAGTFPKAEADPSGTGPDPETLVVDLTPDDLRVTVTATVAKQTGPANLARADTVVGGGRGLKEPDNFRLIEDLAAALDAAVGATRAVTDAGWRPHHEQIGQTGVTIQPRLYIAVGISGAIQHNVGMQGADYIVAINRDPDAPIFKIASFGIVGDLFEILPALTAAVRAARG